MQNSGAYACAYVHILDWEMLVSNNWESASEYLLQHSERLEVGEVGKVEFVVEVELLKQAGAFRSAESEHAHRAIGHAHEFGHKGSVSGFKHICMKWMLASKGGRPEVEVAACRIAIHIGHESQEPSKAEQEHQMKVGKVPETGVEPFDASQYKRKYGPCIGFTAHGMVQEFCQKESYGRFVWVVG